jgi:hypothetical protein
MAMQRNVAGSNGSTREKENQESGQPCKNRMGAPLAAPCSATCTRMPVLSET